jgi:hypothetical protein
MGSPSLLGKALGVLLLAAFCAGEGLPVQYGLLPTGDLTTTDQDGPYFIPAVQAVEVEGMRSYRASNGAPWVRSTESCLLGVIKMTARNLFILWQGSVLSSFVGLNLQLFCR